MSHRSIAVAGLAIVCLTALGGTAAAALQPVPVKHTPLREELPAAGGTIFAWSQNSAGHPGVDNIWVEVGGGGAVRLNAPGSLRRGGRRGRRRGHLRPGEPERPQRIRMWNATTQTFSSRRGSTPGARVLADEVGPVDPLRPLRASCRPRTPPQHRHGETVVLATVMTGRIRDLPRTGQRQLGRVGRVPAGL